jgi:hypothetical protein
MHMHAIKDCRAFVLPYVMMISVILIAIVALILAHTQAVISSTQAIEEKNSSFNAAEAGLNAALDSLDTSLLMIGSRSATLPNGYRYQYTIYPNLLGALGTLLKDPILGQGDLVIPALSAVIVSNGSGPKNERPSTVQALVAINIATINFQRYAIVAGRNIQGTYLGAVRDTSGGNGAVLHAGGSINASVAGGVAGDATASGDTNTLLPHTVNSGEVSLPTVSQFDTMVSNFENQTTLFPGPANVYVPDGGALASGYACPSGSSSGGCLLFYDGALDMPSQQVSFSGQWTVVVNGDFSQTGVSSMTFASRPGILIVNGNAQIEGNGVSSAYVEVKGSTAFGGSGDFQGALITLGNFTFDDDSSGFFAFDASVLPPPKIIAGRVKVVTYAEF